MEVYGYFSPNIKISHRHINNKIFVDYSVLKGQQVSVVGLDISIPSKVVDKVGLKTFLASQLPNHMMPKRIRVASVSVGHRFKRA